tara:strand:- start:191 stop:691 length:501 start_codon:yes stop_codon:yes gene_type:complete
MLKIDILKPENVTMEYVNWFKSKEVIKYSDNQYRYFSLDSQKKYVDSCLENENIELNGIFYNQKHIGNICLKGLKSFHSRAEISYVIGDIEYWGKGIATYAVKYITKTAGEKYSLKRFFASVSSENIASNKVLLNSGFSLEGIRKKHLFYNKKWQDQKIYGLVLNK